MLRLRGLHAAALFLLLAPRAVSYAQEPQIFPINSKPFGLTYGEWAARWWQWALSIPLFGQPD